MGIELEAATREIYTGNGRVSLRVPVNFINCGFTQAFGLDVMVSDPRSMDIIGLKVMANEFLPDEIERMDEDFYTELAYELYMDNIHEDLKTRKVNHRIEKNFGAYPFVVIIDDIHSLDLGIGYEIVVERRFYCWGDDDWMIVVLAMSDKQDSSSLMGFYEDCIKTLYVRPRGHTGLRI